MTQSSAKDPVCGMTVDPASARPVSHYKGRGYYFCAETCQTAFEEDPEKYIEKRGFLFRFLDRLSDANRKEYGSKRPSCCN